MAERDHRGGLMRLVQRLADVAAVARARYGQQLRRERQRLGVSQSPDASRQTPVARSEGQASGTASVAAAVSHDPPGSRDRTTQDGQGSEKHQDSRAKIGDPDARPAPPNPHSPPEPCQDHVVPRGAWAIVKELFRRFGKDQCPVYAAALSFFSILSVVPVLVVALAALAFIFQDPGEAMRQLYRLLANILPGDFAGKAAQDIMQDAHVQSSVEGLIKTRGIAGVIGLVSLIWAALQIFVNAAPAMNAAFEVEETRSWLRLRLVALGLLLGAGALFLLSLLPSTGPDFIRRLHWFTLPSPVPWYIEGLFWLVALALNASMFALIYKFLPNTATTWRQAFVGGLVAGVLWEAAKQGFSYYVENFGSYNKVYGTLGGIIVLVLWIYYTSMVQLLGAEATSLYSDITEAASEPEQGSVPSPSPSPTGRRARV